MHKHFAFLITILLLAAPVAAEEVFVDILDFEFNAKDITVKEGDTVTWVNTGNAPHTVKFSFRESDVLQPNAEFSHTFAQSGSFQYQCGLHPSMTGSVVVTRADVTTTPQPKPKPEPAKFETTETSKAPQPPPVSPVRVEQPSASASSLEVDQKVQKAKVEVQQLLAQDTQQLRTDIATTQSGIDTVQQDLSSIRREVNSLSSQVETLSGRGSPSGVLMLITFIMSLAAVVGVGVLLFLVLKKPVKQQSNPQLRDYVMYALRSGQTTDKIKSDLLSQGWQEADVDKVLSQSKL